MSSTLDDVDHVLSSLRSEYVEAALQGRDDHAISVLVKHHRIAHDTAALNTLALKAAERSSTIGSIVEAVTYYVNVVTLFFPLLDPDMKTGSCGLSSTGGFQCMLTYIGLAFLLTHLIGFPVAHLIAFRHKSRPFMSKIISVLDHSPLRIVSLVVRTLAPNSRTVQLATKDETEYLFLLFWNVQFVCIAVVAMARDSSFDAVSNLWAILATSLMEMLSNIQRYTEHARPSHQPQVIALLPPSGIWAIARRRELMIQMFLAAYLTVVTAVVTGPIFYHGWLIIGLVLLLVNAGNACVVFATRKYPDARDTSGSASLEHEDTTFVGNGSYQKRGAFGERRSIHQYGLWDRLAHRLHISKVAGNLPRWLKIFVVILVSFVYFMSLVGMLKVSRAIVDELARERAIHAAKKIYSQVRARLVNSGLDVVMTDEEAHQRRKMIEESLDSVMQGRYLEGVQPWAEKADVSV